MGLEEKRGGERGRGKECGVMQKECGSYREPQAFPHPLDPKPYFCARGCE